MWCRDTDKEIGLFLISLDVGRVESSMQNPAHIRDQLQAPNAKRRDKKLVQLDDLRADSTPIYMAGVSLPRIQPRDIQSEACWFGILYATIA
jgi:hypothetical protein